MRWNNRDDEKFSREFFIKKVLWQEPENGLKLICLLISDLRKCSKIARNRARDLLLAKNGKIRPLKCQFIQQSMRLSKSRTLNVLATFFCKSFLVFGFLCNFAVCQAVKAVTHTTHYWGAWAFALAEIIPVEPDTDNADAGTRFSFHLFNRYCAHGKKKTSNLFF